MHGARGRFIARFDVANACFELEDAFDEVHNLVNTPFDGCSYEYLHEESSSPCFIYAFPNPLGHSNVSPMCSQPSISSEYSLHVLIDNPKICDPKVDLGYEDNMFNMLGGNIDNFLSLGSFRGYDPSIDTYCICLEDLPRKIM